MLAELLEQVVQTPSSGCAVSRWLAVQDERVNKVFKIAIENGLPNYQRFYDIIKEDALTKNEEVPFGISTFKHHIQRRCVCSKIRK